MFGVGVNRSAIPVGGSGGGKLPPGGVFKNLCRGGGVFKNISGWPYYGCCSGAAGCMNGLEGSVGCMNGFDVGCMNGFDVLDCMNNGFEGECGGPLGPCRKGEPLFGGGSLSIIHPSSSSETDLDLDPFLLCAK